MSLPLSPSSTWASSILVFYKVHISVSLFGLSLKLSAEVCFSCFTNVPSSSSLWEISFPFALSSSPSVIDRVCLWVMARLRIAMFFPGLSMLWPRIMAFETKGVAILKISCSFVHLSDRPHCHHHMEQTIPRIPNPARPYQHPNLPISTAIDQKDKLNVAPIAMFTSWCIRIVYRCQLSRARRCQPQQSPLQQICQTGMQSL